MRLSRILVVVLTAALLQLGGVQPARAAPVNLATVTCLKYQNEMLASTDATKQVDPINTVMWLFGYSVARTGAHVMYGDALTGFGFALDAECKDNPNESLQAALGAVKVIEKNPMDLSSIDCGGFSQRHLGMKKSDPESADTIMTWLLGFQVGKANGRVMDSALLGGFETAFLAECAKQPLRSVYDTLSTMKF